MTQKTTLCWGLQKCIGELWQKEEYSDFTVVVEDTPYHCHRLILSACSKFFKDQFQAAQLQGRHESHANLDGMTKETFDIIINSIYNGADGLTEDNVLDVWSAVKLLQIAYLIEECQIFMICNMSVDNCFRYLNHSVRFWPNVMCFIGLNFIAKNFEQVKDTDSFLQLPSVLIYKVITSDSLVTSLEDFVIDALFKWVEFVPGTSDRQAGNGGNQERSNNDQEEEDDHGQEGGGGDQEEDSDQEEYNDQEEDSDQEEDNSYQGSDEESECTYNLGNMLSRLYSVDRIQRVLKNATRDMMKEGDMVVLECGQGQLKHPTTGHVAPADQVTSICQTDSKEERKQKFLELISACRLFLGTPIYLKHLLVTRRDLLMITGAYNLLLKAVTYTSTVGKRHDPWPEAAVHRCSSSNKHVMVYFSENKFMAYWLSTGSTHAFATVPNGFYENFDNGRIGVFDNVLHFIYEDKNKCILMTKLTKQDWDLVSDSGLVAYSRKLLLAHGNYIYDFRVDDNNFVLCRFSCIRSATSELTSRFCAFNTTDHCLISFQKYIIIFGTKYNVISALYFDTETDKTYICDTTMDGTSDNMLSFCCGEDVYLLQRNGSFWKIFSTETEPVNFELIHKFWNFDCSLRGGVLYRKKLYIFCNTTVHQDTETKPKEIPGIFEDIKLVQINTRTQCVPMVLPRSWLN